MASGIGEKPLSFYARIAGISILLTGATAIFANIFVMGGLIVPDDAAATATNISGNDLLFRFGVLGFLIVFLLDLVVAWALYILMKQLNKRVALLATFFRLVYSALSSAALFHFLDISQLVNDADSLEITESDQVNIEVMLSINAVNNAWSIGLVFFAVHLFVLGYLIVKSGFIPKVLGTLLMLAGLGYFIDNITWVLLSDYAASMAVLALLVLVLGIIAELAFAIWLLAKGKNLSGNEFH